MNRTQIRDHNDIHFDDKIYTENNGYGGLGLGC